MDIVVFDAAGNIGRRIVAEALARRHDVTAVVRDPTEFCELPAAAFHLIGDAGNVEDVARCSSGQNVVINANRPAPGNEGEYLLTAKALLAGLAGTGVRLVAIAHGGSLTDALPARRTPALACGEQLAAFHESTDVNWSYIISPAILTPGERTGRYRLGADEPIVASDLEPVVSMEDLAVAILDEVEQPNYQRVRLSVVRY
jgi:putative NADH-flavin reductase